MTNTKTHYVNALQETGVTLRTHDVYVVHILSENQPPFFTRDLKKVKALMDEYDSGVMIYVEPVHEVNNVVYIDDSMTTYTKLLHTREGNLE